MYLYINLYDQRDRGALDPSHAVARLQEQFPEAIVLPEDQLALSARRAEANLDLTKAADRAVVGKLKRDAQDLGPAYAFHIPAGPESRVNGVVRRYQADFESDAPISGEMRGRIIAFLRSLIPLGMTVEVHEECDQPAAAEQG